MNQLPELSALLQEYNAIGDKIAAVTGRPAQIGHTGEYIASIIFDIQLEHSAVARAIDGKFVSGPLKCATVNVKWYAKQENLLDVAVGIQPDYYLVLAGPKSAAVSSRGLSRPWLIRSIFLFASPALLAALHRTGVKIGVATSLRRQLWDAAMIYPEQCCRQLVLSEEQRAWLRLFA